MEPAPLIDIETIRSDLEKIKLSESSTPNELQDIVKALICLVATQSEQIKTYRELLSRRNGRNCNYCFNESEVCSIKPADFNLPKLKNVLKKLEKERNNRNSERDRYIRYLEDKVRSQGTVKDGNGKTYDDAERDVSVERRYVLNTFNIEEKKNGEVSVDFKTREYR